MMCCNTRFYQPFTNPRTLLTTPSNPRWTPIMPEIMISKSNLEFEKTTSGFHSSWSPTISSEPSVPFGVRLPASCCSAFVSLTRPCLVGSGAMGSVVQPESSHNPRLVPQEQKVQVLSVASPLGPGPLGPLVPLGLVQQRLQVLQEP